MHVHVQVGTEASFFRGSEIFSAVGWLDSEVQKSRVFLRTKPCDCRFDDFFTAHWPHCHFCPEFPLLCSLLSFSSHLFLSLWGCSFVILIFSSFVFCLFESAVLVAFFFYLCRKFHSTHSAPILPFCKSPLTLLRLFLLILLNLFQNLAI